MEKYDDFKKRVENLPKENIIMSWYYNDLFKDSRINNTIEYIENHKKLNKQHLLNILKGDRQ